MRDFLDFLMSSEGFVEVRSIKDGDVKQWFERDRQKAVDLALAQSDAGWDAYFGVLPRTDHKGDAEHIENHTPILWADIDAKDHVSKAGALQSLIRYENPPSVVVDSGHGYHAYWRLRGEIDFPKARQIMVGIAKQLKGDHVYDQARILRIPGTTNWKDPKLPMPVRTVVFNTTTRYRIGQFATAYMSGADAPPTLRTDPRRTYTNLSRSELPAWLVDLIRDGVPQGERSEACWKVMKKLIDRGWSDNDILSAFETGNIGEKMREMKKGEAWFNYSLAKARTTA